MIFIPAAVADEGKVSRRNGNPEAGESIEESTP
jgi:hypothetical protein